MVTGPQDQGAQAACKDGRLCQQGEPPRPRGAVPPPSLPAGLFLRTASLVAVTAPLTQIQLQTECQEPP